MHVAEASDRHGLGHCALGLWKTAQLDPERVFAQGWHSGVLEPPGLSNPLKSKVVWKWFHVAFFACSAVYANLCMSSKQYWTTVIAESLRTSGKTLRPCGLRWLKMGAQCERQRKKKPWMTAVGRTEKSATLNLTYKGDHHGLSIWKSVAKPQSNIRKHSNIHSHPDGRSPRPSGGARRNATFFWRSDASSIHRQDGARVEYLQGYLSQMHKAISNGVEVKGYLATWIQIDWDCLRMGRLWKPH